MIKLNKLISEAFRHYLYGDDTVHWTVKKAYDAHVFYGGSERTGQYTTAGPGGSKMVYKKKSVKMRIPKGVQISNVPGGVFVVSYDTKTAYEIDIKKPTTGKPKNFEKRTSRIIDYSLWKRWLKK